MGRVPPEMCHAPVRTETDGGWRRSGASGRVPPEIRHAFRPIES